MGVIVAIVAMVLLVGAAVLGVLRNRNAKPKARAQTGRGGNPGPS